MSVAESGLAGAGVLAVGLMLGGCSSTDVSAGSEGDAVNLSHCFGADCGSQAQSLASEAPHAQTCGDVVGPLEDGLVFEVIAPGVQARAIDAKEASDGSVWSIQSVTSLQKGNAGLYLAHHATDGHLLAVSDEIDAEAAHTVLDAALAVDVNGGVTLAVYSSFAETADSDVIEHLTIYGFDHALQPTGLPRAFRGMATPHMASGALGSVWLAGNAAGNAPHGALARITNGEPDWIQTAVPTSGASVVGVSALTVADDGFAAVVAQLNPKWSGSGANVMKLGISTFDESGKPVWTLPLPNDFTPGYGGGLGGTAAGDLVVSGVVGADSNAILVQGISRAGQLRWSYEVPSGIGGAMIDVQRRSGRTFVGSQGGLAVIDADGEDCRQFSVGPALEGEPAPWQADAEYVLAVGGALTRLRVPE